MMEKMGEAALEQVTSMMVAISHFSLSEVLLTLSSIIRSLTSSSLLRRVPWRWLGPIKIVRDRWTSLNSWLRK